MYNTTQDKWNLSPNQEQENKIKSVLHNVEESKTDWQRDIETLQFDREKLIEQSLYAYALAFGFNASEILKSEK